MIETDYKQVSASLGIRTRECFAQQPLIRFVRTLCGWNVSFGLKLLRQNNIEHIQSSACKRVQSLKSLHTQMSLCFTFSRITPSGFSPDSAPPVVTGGNCKELIHWSTTGGRSEQLPCQLVCLDFRKTLCFVCLVRFKESHDVKWEMWLAVVVSSDSLQLILTRHARWTKRGGEVRSLKTPTLCRAQWTHHVGQQQQLTFSLNRRFWLHSWLQRGSGWSPWRGGTPWLRGFHGNPSAAAAAQKRRHHIFGSFSVHLWPFCCDLSVSVWRKVSLLQDAEPIDQIWHFINTLSILYCFCSAAGKQEKLTTLENVVLC